MSQGLIYIYFFLLLLQHVLPWRAMRIHFCKTLAEAEKFEAIFQQNKNKKHFPHIVHTAIAICPKKSHSGIQIWSLQIVVQGLRSSAAFFQPLCSWRLRDLTSCIGKQRVRRRLDAFFKNSPFGAKETTTLSFLTGLCDFHPVQKWNTEQVSNSHLRL